MPPFCSWHFRLLPLIAPALFALAVAPARAGYGGSAVPALLNATHPSGYVYDEYWMSGALAAFTADAGQVAKVLFLDQHGDMVVVDFSGAGSLTVSLENATGPTPAANYNLAGSYMTGVASLSVTGHNATTRLAVYSLGSVTATSQSVIRNDVTYEGVADLRQVTIADVGANQFGRLDLANARLSASSGVTGINASGVSFTLPVQLFDVTASGSATPTLVLGPGRQLQIRGGSLFQPNGRPIQFTAGVSLMMTQGFKSNGVLLPVQANVGTFTNAPGTPTVTATLVPAALTIGSQSTRYTLNADAFGAWLAAVDVPWLHATPVTGPTAAEVEIVADANTTGADRTGTVSIGNATHTLIQKAAGSGLRELWATGSNSSGQLADGTWTQRLAPRRVAGGVRKLSAGLQHGLLVMDDGTLWTVGENIDRQLGDGTTIDRIRPIQVATGVTAVSGGEAHSLFLKADGTVWGMGLNIDGELGDGTNLYRSPPVQTQTGIAKIFAGGYHSFFVKHDGTLWATGNNQFGQLGDGAFSNRTVPVQVAGRVIAATGNGLHSLILKADGTLWAMGLNSTGQLGDGTTTTRFNPVPVATGVVGVWSGPNHSLFLKADATLWAMGSNGSGQLGDGTTTQRLLPVQVATGVASADAGTYHSLFLKSDDTLWATGYNANGQLGDGTTSTRLSPVKIADHVASFAAGGHFSYYVTADGPLAAAPVIVAQPKSQNLAVVGGSVDFSVTATGTGLSYQWLKNGSPIVGATAATLSLSNLQSSDAGSYSVVVSNARDEVLSGAATLGLLGQGTAGSQFVVVGQGGAILTSPDGQAWTSRISGTTMRLRAVAANANQFVVVGERGTILTSANGATWTPRYTGTIETLRGVAVGPDRFVAVGGWSAGYALTSSDGIGWAPVTLPGGTGKLRAATWGNGLYVAVGAGGGILTSADGTTWTARTSGTSARLDGVYWTGTQFHVVSESGSVLSSADGVSWNSSASATPPSWLEGLAWSGDRYLVVGAGGAIATSPDGAVWTNQSSGTTATLHGVAWSGTRLTPAGNPVDLLGNLANIPVITTQPVSQAVLGVGETAVFTVAATGTGLDYQWLKNGSPISGATSATLTLSNLQAGDGGTYSAVVTGASGSAISAEATLTLLGQGTAGSQFVVAGQGGALLTSPDGETWTSRTSGTTMRLRAVAANANRFVVVGERGTIVTSDDGATWATRTSGTIETLRGVAAGPNQFVAVGGWSAGYALRSADGATWTPATLPGGTGKLRAVACGGGTYVAVGAGGAIVTSPDGVTWTTRTSGTAARLDGVYWTGTQFYVVSESGNVLASADGATWNSAPASAPPSWLESLAWSDSGYLVVGAGGGIATSPNGSFWTVVRAGISATLHGVAWSGSRLVPAGNPVTLLANLSGFPAITEQTPWQTVFAGTNAVFAVTAPAATGFQWERSTDGGATWAALTNGGAFAGVTTSSLTVGGVDATMNAWKFRVVASSASGAMSSNPAGLTALNTTPGFLWGQPASWLLTRSTPRSITGEVAMVAAGSEHTLFIKSDGALWSMGLNYMGQLGNGTPDLNPHSTPVQVATGVASVAARSAHTLFVKTDGTLWAMGSNSSGQLGDGTTTSRSTPVQVASGVASVAPGAGHTLFVKTDGTLWAVGRNTTGQLGTGTTTNQLSPVQVASGVASVAAGDSSYFIKVDGTLWAMGDNTNGHLGDGTTTQRLVPVQVATGVASVAASDQFAMFVKVDGTLWAMGWNSSGQLGDGTTTNRSTPVQVATNVARVAAGPNFTHFLKTDGTVWAMGRNHTGHFGNGSTSSQPQTTPVQVGSDVESIAAGMGHVLWKKNDGTLVAMGANGWGQLGDRQELPGLPPIATEVVAFGVNGVGDGLFVKSNGTLWQEVDGQVAQVPGVTGVIQAYAGTYGFNRLYLKSDGSLWRLLDNNGTSAQIANDVIAAGAGLSYVAAYLKRDGTLWRLYGENAPVYAGDGSIPVQIADHVTSLSTTGWHLLYVKDDNTLWGIGQPWSGFTDPVVWGQHELTPVQLETGVSVASASVNAGNRFIRTDGTLWTRGSGWAAATGPAVEVDNNVTAVAAGSIGGQQASLYLKADGVLRSRTGIMGTLGNVVEIAGGVQAVKGGPDGWAMFLQTAGHGTAPQITTQPQPASVTAGAVVTLQVAVTGTGPLGYQWYKDGVALPWAQSATCTIPYALAADAGSYTVTVTNSAGSVTSAAAALTVAVPQAQSITFSALPNRPFTATPITLSATATSGLPVSFVVVSGPATVSGSELTLTGTGSVTVRAAQAGNATYAAATAVDRTFTVTGSLEHWKLSRFTAGERADATISGPTADPDGDGLTNLLEYALGLEPKTANTTGLPELTTSATDWVYTYTRPADRADLSYAVEFTTNLTANNWSTAGVVHELAGTGAGTEIWRARVSLGAAANAYFRLKVEQN